MPIHQRVVVERGTRSGFPIVVAVHSTALGQAVGGCRMAVYRDWRAGLDDALRLSTAMTSKAALAGLPHGGGAAVVVLPRGAFGNTAGGLTADGSMAWGPTGGMAEGVAGGPMDGMAEGVAGGPMDGMAGGLAGGVAVDRRAVLHDVGDVVRNLGGVFSIGPDVGTGPADMRVIGERTDHVLGRAGDSGPAAAAGVVAAIQAVVADRFGSPSLSGRTFAVLGVGRVGVHLVDLLSAAGGKVLAADVDGARRTVVESLGATWTDPRTCLTADVDVLVPAALGGVLTAATVPTLRCAAVAGPANAQLDEPATADLLHERGILWAPDVVAGSGGIIHAVATELHRETPPRVAARVAGIGDTLTRILDAARETSSTPAAAASRLAGFLIGEPVASTMAAC
ncbi:Glu/Leu/Phe/Val dehydrogenase [Actinoplanes sichuanensis]|uniref:Glu/Leu/Phe/Val dehydrogenase dimerization domain-containing protein n=1 Tax=Actinoplanes sichuanensis TaxID=512349 RepID=A0ABW4AIV0_9ACTN|nr:Glu/Leu/Phe/Val dehydrogenase dimerization domain-containing protein [Actinoplanes sichuanensis]BEL02093.1 Glu/Leu/Phe/Val dehydrogenase [Actinoplanes sichuanensis]